MNEHLDRDLEYTDGELENLTTSELIRATFQASRYSAEFLSLYVIHISVLVELLTDFC